MSLRLQHAAEALGAGLPPLLVVAEQLAANVSLGVHGRRKPGTGEDFWQFRRHRAEDPASVIDWRQSARTRHLYVREREWESAQTVWFWCDASAGMRFGSADDNTKVDRAALLMLALASLLLRAGERVGLIGADAPSSARASLARMAQAWERQAGDALPPRADMGRRGHCVWLSDFLSPIADIETRMAAMAAQGIHGQLVRIVDPAEEDFPYRGRTLFAAPSDAGTMLMGRAENIREAYRARFVAHGEALAAVAARHGFALLTHRIDRAPLPALMALYTRLAGDIGP